MKKIDSKLEKESILQIIKTYLSKNLCKKSPRWGVGGCTFCDYRGSALGCFSTHLGVTPTFCAQLQAAMEAIEIAHRRGWNCLWLECDSSLVVQTYGSHQLFPWWLRTHCCPFTLQKSCRKHHRWTNEQLAEGFCTGKKVIVSILVRKSTDLQLGSFLHF